MVSEGLAGTCFITMQKVLRGRCIAGLSMVRSGRFNKKLLSGVDSSLNTICQNNMNLIYNSLYKNEGFLSVIGCNWSDRSSSSLRYSTF